MINLVILHAAIGGRGAMEFSNRGSRYRGNVNVSILSAIGGRGAMGFSNRGSRYRGNVNVSILSAIEYRHDLHLYSF